MCAVDWAGWKGGVWTEDVGPRTISINSLNGKNVPLKLELIVLPGSEGGRSRRDTVLRLYRIIN